MGRTSKFLFPSRKNQTTRATSKAQDQDHRPPPPPPLQLTPGLTKAQRILGTDALNFDTTHEDLQVWGNQSRSTSHPNVADSIKDSDEEEEEGRKWEAESGALQTPSRLRAKASSTLLGQHDGGYEESSDGSILNEDSSSTLRSTYDRHKENPLITQQTSSSSVRDLALRKGMAPVMSPRRSPLSNFDCAGEGVSREIKSKSSKKKLGRLDLSKLFPKPRQDTGNPMLLGPDALTRSPSALSFVSASNTYHFPQPNRSITPLSSSPLPDYRPETASNIRPHKSLPSLLERHARKSSAPELPLAAIPDRSSSRRPYVNNVPMRRTLESLTGPHILSLHTPPPSLGSSTSPMSKMSQFSWKNAHASASTTTWDSGSAISAGAMSMSSRNASAMSISSRNTKASRKTTASIFEMVDLAVCSVLSLTSDEEDSDEDADHGIESRMASAKPYNHGVVGPAPGGGGMERAVENERAGGRTGDARNQRSLLSHRRRISSSSVATCSSVATSSSLPTGFLKPPSRVDQPQPPQTETIITRRSVNGKKVPKSLFRDNQFLPIPLPSPVNARLSGPWGEGALSPLVNEFPDVPRHGHRPLHSKDGRIDTSTPPLSPADSLQTSFDSRQASGKRGRLMAVNAEERALLETLRSRKMRMMKDSIAEDDELSPQSPAPPIHEKEFYSKRELPPSPPRQRSRSRQISRSRRQKPGRSHSPLALRDSTISHGSSGGSESILSHPCSIKTRRSAGVARSPSRERSRSNSQIRPSRSSPQAHPITTAPSQPPPKSKRRPTEENIPLYLERESSDLSGDYPTAEPSPDLSEFYRESFGLGSDYRGYYSDEEEAESASDVQGAGVSRGNSTRASTRTGRRYSNSSFNDYDSFANFDSVSIVGCTSSASASTRYPTHKKNRISDISTISAATTSTSQRLGLTPTLTALAPPPTRIPLRLSAVGGAQEQRQSQPLQPLSQS